MNETVEGGVIRGRVMELKRKKWVVFKFEMTSMKMRRVFKFSV